MTDPEFWHLIALIDVPALDDSREDVYLTGLYELARSCHTAAVTAQEERVPLDQP